MDTNMPQQQPQQPPQDVTQWPAMVTLPIGTWERVTQYIAKNPWIEVNPLMLDISRQVNDAIQAHASTLREPDKSSQSTTAAVE
jgi:hypothetical protein